MDGLYNCPVPWCDGLGALRESPITKLAYIECNTCDCETPMCLNREVAKGIWNNNGQQDILGVA